MSDQYETNTGWMRVLFVAIFWFIFYLTQLVIAAVVIAQCLFTLLTSKPNEYLLKFGESLSKYVQEILRYVTFNTDVRPFPFSDFPKSDIVITAESSESQ